MSKFYHIKNLQSTKTGAPIFLIMIEFYHIKNLQSTKTALENNCDTNTFYHIKNLQSTKTNAEVLRTSCCFITLRIYKVLKPDF